ncbi:DNA-3-methyladenine glycosylase I [Belliella kenyensis]|uniref:DNA-3-methyladenine glycosylase I n=1 Tax=Belliella kenyensis TaxID=1472724 RepID=A0ABV8EMI3_9BACT|nr:DNA-3-methyladenine glycosylase I [Belliella kenyensis]MCH7401580.1 DNA-3-methyladenine glycosylase I [Belliella kenyensis]MDN3603140.1 DNA-3-methyladenine glycosylase I [Belliella kenyensis]
MENGVDKMRCPWCMGFQQYIDYHDEEWGVPVYEDNIHFEFLVLESAQAGLSWATILKKREGYRKAFADFDYKIVADFPESYLTELLSNPDIIRNKLKINAAVNNAKRFMEVQSQFGSFTDYIWDFVDGKVIDNALPNMKNAPATSQESDKLAKDMKKRGFKFLGSTTLYAHMQATGLVNDHLTSCFRYEEVKLLAK